MLSDAGDASTLARDTVFAAMMIILNGIVGLCLLAGGIAHGEQCFTLRGVSAALCTLAAMSVLSLVLPNYVSGSPGPTYAPSQLVFVAIVSLILYSTFVGVQTVRHREYFLPAGGEEEHVDARPRDRRHRLRPAACRAGRRGAARQGPVAGHGGGDPRRGPAARPGRRDHRRAGPAPESLAAFRAARANRLQTSLNLALGSALATIGLTIPAVAVVSLVLGLPLALGIGAK